MEISSQNHMNTRSVTMALVIVVVIVIAGLAGFEYGKSGTSSASTGSSIVTLHESGSSLLYPAFNEWVNTTNPAYSAVSVTTASTGSGNGISYATKGSVQIGASDAYMLPSVANANPNAMNIPILISYQYIVYNLPGLNNVHLNLSAGILAGIYSGKITNWDNSAIAKANPGVSLPNHAITAIHRQDGSGDTFMFTSFLSKGNATWNTTVGSATSVQWPSIPQPLAETGNQGMLKGLQNTKYSIAYVAATYNKTIAKDGFGIAHLKNRAGNFVAPTPANVASAANYYLPQIPANGTIALQFAPGATSYPIADMEYVIVLKTQPGSVQALELKDFLSWIVNSNNGGSQASFLAPLDLAPLPTSVVNNVTLPLINKISG